MSDEETIRSLIGRYAQLIDDGDFDEWGDLFVDDARLDAAGHVLDGRAAILDFIRSSYGGATTTHMFSVPDIVVDTDEARVATDFLLVQNNGTAAGVGRTHDVWVRSDGRWRLSSRQITLKT